MTKRRTLLALLLALALAVFGAGCGGDDDDDGGGDGGGEAAERSDVRGSVQAMAVWSGPEQRAFEAVLEGFREQHPNVRVRYNSAGDQLPTVLSTAVEGGNPPDVAVVPQPGLMRDFVQKRALKPISFARETIEEGFSEDWVDLGTVDGELYGLTFKGANKSTVWFNTQVFSDAGVEPPGTWDEFLEAAETVNASGVPAFSIAGADGWTLTDLFENIYLRTAGPEKYDQLAEHEIPWTDQSVKDALAEMAKVIGNSDNLAGGTRSALQTDFPSSVTRVFGSDPEAAMVIEGDFVAGVITDSTDARPGEGFDVFPFPQIGDAPENTVVGGGDTLVMFEDSPAARALVEYLATPEAAEIWARRGGFSSPNRNVDASVYPDEITRRTATALAEAEVFRFDMSDLAPASFGGTPGQGEWKILQDFLRNPDDVDGTAEALERAAARAYRRGE